MMYLHGCIQNKMWSNSFVAAFALCNVHRSGLQSLVVWNIQHPVSWRPFSLSLYAKIENGLHHRFVSQRIYICIYISVGWFVATFICMVIIFAFVTAHVHGSLSSANEIRCYQLKKNLPTYAFTWAVTYDFVYQSPHSLMQFQWVKGGIVTRRG